MLWREDGHVLRGPIEFEVEDQRKNVSPRRTWMEQVEEEILKVGLSGEDDVFCRSECIVGVSLIAAGLR